MDFSRKGVVNKQRQIKSTTKRLNTKLRVSIYRIALVCVVFVGIVGCFAVYGAAKGMINSAPDIKQITIDPEGFTTHIYYSDGSLSGTLIGAEANRVQVSIEEIPDVLEHAFIALEDERFYEHDGIDMRGIFRAGFSVVKTGGLGFGASTITQQLLKNKVFGGGDEENNIDKIVRKVQEQYLAVQLENQFNKDEILEAYMNVINLGNGSFGVQTAAQSYFGKDIKDLTLSESSVIAGIALSPVYCNPINYPEKNAERRKKCLDNMLRLGYCTQEEYDQAMADDVYTRIQNFAEERGDTNSSYSYFTDALIKQIISDLQTEKGYTQAQASNLLYSGGLSIYTTQDNRIQSIVDRYYQNEENFPALGEGSYYEVIYKLSVTKPDGTTTHYQTSDFINYFSDFDDTEKIYYHKKTGNYKGISEYGFDADDMYEKTEQFKAAMLSAGDIIAGEVRTITLQPQSSMVIVDQHTGNVVALYGGRGEKTGKRTLNRATDTVRNVGSTFKVLAAFLPALDTSGMTLATVFDDSPYTYPGTDAKVTNWNGEVYKGLSSIREGIYNSMNIIACRTMEAVTPKVGFDYLKKLGFTTLIESEERNGQIHSDIGIPLALGGLTDGVTNLELTAAYATIANEGIYNKPILYTKVIDHSGKVLLSKEATSTQVIKTSTAYLLTSAMMDTVTKGTGGNLRFRDYTMPVAGKTGTTSDYKDLWFVGYTPYYTAGIWTGFDNNFSQTNKKYHQFIWRNVMEDIHSSLNLENKAFTRPDSIVEATICSKSGKLAVPGLCDKAHGGSTVRVELFAKGTVPTEKCTDHVKVSICTQSGSIASPYCPLNLVKETVFLKKEETSTTWDTPNVLPTGDNAICPIHSEHSVITPPSNSVPDNELPEIDPPTVTVSPSVKPTITPSVIIIPPGETEIENEVTLPIEDDSNEDE